MWKQWPSFIHALYGVMGRRSFAWLQLDTITRATQHMWVEAVGLDDLWSADVIYLNEK